MLFKRYIRSVVLSFFFSVILLLTMNSFAADPTGYIDVIADGYVHGWAYDPDAPSSPIDVHFYFDGPAGSGWGTYSTTTDKYRPDVNNTLNISGNHGFQFPIPAMFRDGGTHTVYAYGMNIGGGYNPPLNNSPTSFSIVDSACNSVSTGTGNNSTNSYSFTIKRVQGGYNIGAEYWVTCGLGTNIGQLVNNSAIINISNFEAVNPSDSIVDFTLWDWTVTGVLDCTNVGNCPGFIPKNAVQVVATAISPTQLRFTWNFQASTMCVNNWVSVEFKGQSKCP